MRQAITTKYLADTKNKGARIHARCGYRSIYVPCKPDLSEFDNHERAAMFLYHELSMSRQYTLVPAALPEDMGYCFIQVTTPFADKLGIKQKSYREDRI